MNVEWLVDAKTHEEILHEIPDIPPPVEKEISLPIDPQKLKQVLLKAGVISKTSEVEANG